MRLVLTILVTSAFVTAFYVWRRDVVANILAHAIVDAVGPVL